MDFSERLLWYGLTAITLGGAALLTPQIAGFQRALGWLFIVAGLCVILYIESNGILSFLRGGYASFGTPYPALSLTLVSLLGAIIFGGAWLFIARSAGISTPSPSVPTVRYFPLPLTMRNLFDTDFSYMSVGSEMILTQKSHPQQPHTIPVRLFMNFDDKSKFIAFFIPRQMNADNTFQLCADVVGSYKSVIEQLEQRTKIGSSIPGETSQTWSNDLTFTGRIFVYYEDVMSLTQLAGLEQFYKQNGLSPQFRGHDYLTLHWNEKRAMPNPTTTPSPPKPLSEQRQAP